MVAYHEFQGIVRGHSRWNYFLIRRKSYGYKAYLLRFLEKTFVRNSSIAHLSVILDEFNIVFFSNCNRIKNKLSQLMYRKSSF
jgi:hypothetical protein